MLERCDIIAGGFPCQDISNAGECAGLGGERSGLWWEMLRAICLVRPKYALVENVAALLDRWMGEVLGSLAASGHDAEWDCLPACAFGAPHERDRVFTLAYPQRGDVSEHRIRNLTFAGAGDEAPDRPRNGLATSRGWWASEPGVDRVGNGVPNEMDRIHSLGNAVVPQIAEWIGRRILEAEKERLGEGQDV